MPSMAFVATSAPAGASVAVSAVPAARALTSASRCRGAVGSDLGGAPRATALALTAAGALGLAGASAAKRAQRGLSRRGSGSRIARQSEYTSNRAPVAWDGQEHYINRRVDTMREFRQADGGFGETLHVQTRFEDPKNPMRPPAPENRRSGKWAPQSPHALHPPDVLVIGLGRQLRESEAKGPRARLGAGAVEALQRRYGIENYFHLDSKTYVSHCKASLDKSGRPGLQRITMLQPLQEADNEVADALAGYMRNGEGYGYDGYETDNMQEVNVLFVVDDNTLPFGQLRMRSAVSSSDPRLKNMKSLLGPQQRYNTLAIGCGPRGAAEAFSEDEASILPRILTNAATAIEVYLSEADVGLVMRFINRPEVYQLPRSITHPEDQNAPSDASGEQQEAASQETARPVNEAMNIGPLIGPNPGDEFALFDINRQVPTAEPNVVLAPMSPSEAMTTVQPRPNRSRAVLAAGRRFSSLRKLEEEMSKMVTTMRLGQHIRFEDDEMVMRSLFAFHPEADRIAEDLVAIKVDCSPVDDNTRCYWAVKYDGYEQDVSLRTCLHGVKQMMQAEPLDPLPVFTRGKGLLPMSRVAAASLQTRDERLEPRDSIFARAAREESFAGFNQP